MGRQGDLHRIAALRRDGGGGVVVVGEPGVGKTRLAVEALAQAEAAGAVTTRVAATRAAAAIPLGALAPLLPELGEGVNPLIAGRGALRTLAGDQPLVLLVDDAHLLDDVSAALILQLAMTREAFVVATVRTGERLPEPVTELWKDGHSERLELRALSDDEVDELTVAVVDGDVEAGAARAVRLASKGNALAVRELVIAAVESGALRYDNGHWHLVDQLPVSDRLIELVDHRVGALSDEETAGLELLAVGEPLGVSLLDELTSPAVVGSLERKGVLDTREDGRRLEAWLAHPFHGEVLRARMSRHGLRRVHGLLADAIERCGARRRGDLLRVATWRLATGVVPPRDLLVEAAAQSVRAFSFDAAGRLAQAAWNEYRDVDAAVLLGRSHLERGLHDEAENVLGAAQELAATDDQLADVAMVRAANLFEVGAVEKALAVIDTARAGVGDADASGRLVCRRAIVNLYTGRGGEALSEVEPLLETSSARVFVDAAMVAGPVLALDGFVHRALELGRRAFDAHLPLWHEGSHLEPPHWHRSYMAQALAYNGELRAAAALAASTREELRASGYDNAAGMFAVRVADIALREGRVDAAVRLARQALAGERNPVERQRWLVLTALGTAMSGDASATRRALDLARRGTPFAPDEPRLLQASAWLATVEGDPASARRLLLEGADVAIAMSQRAVASTLLHDLVRLGSAIDAADRIVELAGARPAALIAAYAAHARAVVADDPEALDAAASGFEAMGALLLAAEAFADAARAWRRSGRARRASASEHRAHLLADRCDGARTPALAGLGTASPLTRREREVALLAAGGLATRAIAARLYLSQRTVDNHLQRIYAKLGVRGRGELRAALGIDAGPPPTTEVSPSTADHAERR